MKVIKIKKINYVDEYQLNIEFSDGTSQTVDFKPFLKGSTHPEIRKFLDLKKFKQFAIRDGELMWGDFDLIFPIMDLYENTLNHCDGELAVSKPRFSSGGR